MYESLCLLLYFLLQSALSNITFYVDGKYIITNELQTKTTVTTWKDIIMNQGLNFCQKNLEIENIGVQKSLTNIYWQKYYNLPLTNRVGVYIEYQVSGVWNDYKLQVYANDVLVYTQIIGLNDQNRPCNINFLYESFLFFTFIQDFDQLILEIKVNKNNLGLFIQNVVIDQRTQSGRNQIIPFYDFETHIPQCLFGLDFIQYYCQCSGTSVFQGICKVECDQNYLYDPQTNQCYLKQNCNACFGKNTILKCNSGFYSYLGNDPINSDCLQRCPEDYYSDPQTMTCMLMKTYLETNENKGCIKITYLDPVDHYFFCKSAVDFFHFFTHNNIFVKVTSTPQKVQERSFFYKNGKFIAGSYETFQSQTILLQIKVKQSQYKLRFRAIGHFIDFIPQGIDIYINGVYQQQTQISPSLINEQKVDQDYVAYFDYYWVRTETYPVTYNNIIFQIQQPKINGNYQGYFYLEDINVYSLRCITGCNACFTINYCTPCLNPANKNPDCTCQIGYYLVNDICIECPTYCESCTQAGVCDNCKLITKRINSPSCDQCPNSYFVKQNEDNCQPCITGCNMCVSSTTCEQCLQGYYLSDGICVINCSDGYFQNENNGNPICYQCDVNCLTCQDQSTKCISCLQNEELINNHCYKCNNGYYLDGIQCLPCPSGCEICQSDLKCLHCQESYYLNQITNQCGNTCDSNYFENDLTRTCDQCHATCQTCIGSAVDDCLTCSIGLKLNKNIVSGVCSNRCQSGFFPVDNYCSKCLDNCSECIDSSSKCLICAFNYYRFQNDGKCYQNCPDGYYNYLEGQVCSICDLNCKTCNGQGPNNCLSCFTPNAIYLNQCYSSCPDGFGNINRECLACASNCKKCYGIQPNECLKCNKGFYYYNSQCYFKCPRSFRGIRPQYICQCQYDNCVICNENEYYYQNVCYLDCPIGLYGYNGLCIECDTTCSSCFNEGPSSCLSCANQLILFENKCVVQCVGNTFHNTNLNTCQQCDDSCLSCKGPNNNDCTACHNQVLTADGYCQDSCPSHQFIIFSEQKCYECDSSCLECFGGTSDNCLSCTNLFYQYRCVDSCPVNTILNVNQCDPNPLIALSSCSYQCKTCSYTSRHCKTCAANRVSNPPNCDCDYGYFDDGHNGYCRKCSNKCLQCQGQEDTCSKCKGNRVLPLCDCPQYYYDDGVSVNCIQCQDNCSTCSEFGCITCLNNRINPPDCICPNGYFESYQNQCLECAKKCSTCQNTENQCQTCSSIREIPPICNCPSGYFENSDEECQICYETCLECDINGCLTCFGNRVGPINKLCPCASDGISRRNIGSLYCTDCTLGVPFFGLNNDFTGFSIDFGLPVSFSATVDQNNICSSIFDSQSLEKLGTNPVCSEYDVYFGQDSSIKVGDQLQLKPVFILDGCRTQFKSILTMPLSIPSTLDKTTHRPQITFNDNDKANICSIIQIKFIKKYYNGGQKLKIISWDQIQPLNKDPTIEQILQTALNNNSENISFPKRTLQPNVKYQFSVTVESFANLRNTQYITFTPSSQPQIVFSKISDQDTFYRNQAITIPCQLSYYSCIEENPSQIFYKVSLEGSNFQVNGTITELFDGFSMNLNLTFDPYYFNSTTYAFVFYTQLFNSGNVQETKEKVKIYIQKQAPTISIENGNRVVGYLDVLNLKSKIEDNDSSLTTYQCYWTCTDIITQNECVDHNNSKLIFDNSCNQSLKGGTFSPYQVMIYQVAIVRDQMQYSNKVSIQITEMNFPQLGVTGINQTQTYNYYDEFLMKLIYTNSNPDELFYAGALIYDSVVQQTFSFQYLEFKFVLANYFTNLTSQLGKKVKLRFSIYDPRFIMSSVNTLGFEMNIPPSNCQLSFNSGQSSYIEFLDQINLEIINCQDEDLPLLYSVQMYPNVSIYKKDLIESRFYNYISILPQQLSNILIFFLPYLNNQQSLLILNIYDSKGGISNITQQIQIKEYINITTSILDDVLNKAETFDQKLIAYSMITARLSNIENPIFKQDLLAQLISLDTEQIYQSNQTDSLYQSILVLIASNTTLIANNQSLILNKLVFRINQGKNQLMELANVQQKTYLSSEQNIEKQNYLQQYSRYLKILSCFITYRFQVNVTSSDIQKNISSIIDTFQAITVANEPLQKINTNSCFLIFGNLTSKQMYLQIGTTLQGDQYGTEETLETTNFYKFSLTHYLCNPFYVNVGFPKNSSGYEAFEPKVAIKNSNETKLSKRIGYLFPNVKQIPINHTQECIAQVNQTNWSADVCKTIKKNDQIFCQCESLSETSLMESLELIGQKAEQIYSFDTLTAFASFPFYKTIIFYFYLTLTMGYVTLTYWGMKVDKRLFMRIAEEQQISEKQSEPIDPQEQLKKKPSQISQSSAQFFRKPNDYISEERQGLNILNFKVKRFLPEDDGLCFPEKQIDVSPESGSNSLKSPEKIDIFTNKLNYNYMTNHSDNQKTIIASTISEQGEEKISKAKACFEYLKYFHQILQIIFKDDEKKPRALRATIVYTSIIGSLTVIFVFNRPDNLSYTLALALLTAPLNKIYQILLEKLLIHERKAIRVTGVVLMLTVGAIMSYTMLAGVLLLGSVETANKWTYIFVSSFSLDNLIYSPISLVFQYALHIRFLRFPFLFDLLNKLVDEKGKEFILSLLKKRGLVQN